MLDKNHQLYELAESVDWALLEGKIVSILGQRYDSHWRTVAGSIYLQSFYDLSSTDLITLWPECRYLRYFCCGERSNSDFIPFPIPQDELERLSRKLIGEGYEIMIKALLNHSIQDAPHNISLTVH